MSEEMIKSVQRLIDAGKGDLARLTEILNTIKQKAPLYLSDYRYIEDLFSKKDPTFDNEVKKNEKKGKKDKKNKQEKNNQTNPSLVILKNRLAAGEISVEEFQSLKKAIMGD